MPRFYNATDFDGNKYATEKWVKETLSLTEDGLIPQSKISGLQDAIASGSGVDLQFNGTDKGQNVKTLNFTGTTEIVVDGNTAKIQIGENVNSSNWNIKDGKNGDGTVETTATTLSFKCPAHTDSSSSTSVNYGNWAANDTIDCATKATSCSFGSKGVIHFNEGANNWTVIVYGADGVTELARKTFINTVTYTTTADGKVNGATISTVSEGSDKITQTLGTSALEPNYPAAVGACATVDFTITHSGITGLTAGGRFKVYIQGCGGTYQKDYFYMTGKTPAIGDITLTQPEEADFNTAYFSGVKYLTSLKSGKFFKAAVTGITNVWNQGATTSSSALINSNSVNLANVGSASAASLVSTYEPTATASFNDEDITISGNGLKKVTVGYKVQNAYGSATSSEQSVKTYNINTSSATGTGADYDEFKNESSRKGYLKDTSTSTVFAADFSSSTTLADNKELQVIPGTGLIYPVTNYSGTNYVPSTNVNYSGLTKETRYFVRQFTNGSGTKTSGKIILKGTFGITKYTQADLKTIIDKIQIRPKEQLQSSLTSKDGQRWYSVLDARGGSNAYGVFNEATYNSSTGITISFTLPGTDNYQAAKGILFRIGFKSNITISKISFTAN